MNQITNRYNAIVKEEYDMCDHVKVGERAYRAIYESDSFGTVGVYACCKECSENLDKQEDEEEVTCHDCGQEFQRKDTVEWKPYDFYAPQGDEPLVICKVCRIADKHLARCRKDRADYNAEFGVEDEEPENATEQFFGEEANRLTEDECQLDGAFLAEPIEVVNVGALNRNGGLDVQTFKNEEELNKFKELLRKEREEDLGDQLMFYISVDEKAPAPTTQPVSEEEKAEFRKRWNLDA
jgi:hypothetical protein